MSFQNPLPPGIRQVVPDYVSDGSTLTWGFPFRLWAPADLYVGVSNDNGATWSALTLGVNYTITLNGATSAIVALTGPPPNGALIRLQGLRTPSRTTSVVNDGVVQSVPFEAELDVIEATCQELRRDISAALAGLAAETARAKAAEAALAAQIVAAVAVETARAVAAELALAQAIAAETARAENAEAALANSIGLALAIFIENQFGIPSPATLPTTLPPGAGVYWNNGGVLCLTPGGGNLLPTSLPTGGGVFWNDGGVVSVTDGGLFALPAIRPSLPYIFWNDGGAVCVS